MMPSHHTVPSLSKHEEEHYRNAFQIKIILTIALFLLIFVCINVLGFKKKLEAITENTNINLNQGIELREQEATIKDLQERVEKLEKNL